MTTGTNTPTLPDLLARIGAFVERERFDAARIVIQDALRNFPDHALLLYYSSFVDWAQGDLDAAERTLQRLLSVDPKHFGGRIQLARLLTSRKKFAEAERVWIELLGENPEDPDLYGEYAELMLNAIWIKKALELAAEGLKLDPEHEHCLYVTALAKVVYGVRADAETALAHLIQRHPERLRTAYALVVALQSKARYEEAYRVSQQALRASPASPEWLHNVREFKVASHWSMKPLYPFQRWGWVASIGLWLLFCLVAVPISMTIGQDAAIVLFLLYLLYVIYSWVWPPILRRLI